MGGGVQIPKLPLAVARVNEISLSGTEVQSGNGKMGHDQQPHKPPSSETSCSICHRVVETVLRAHGLHLALKLYALRFGVLTLGG